MRYKLLIITMLSILGMNNPHIYSQNYKTTPVTISKEKIKSNDGKIYYSHLVLEKQTLYSISKAYGVSIDDIYKANPEIKKTGLRTNSIILIPCNNTEKQVNEKNEKINLIIDKNNKVEESPDTKTNDNLENIPFFTHSVRWYENLDDIALKYNVPADYIIRLNHLKDKKIRNRMELKIPKNPKDIEDIILNEKKTKEREFSKSINNQITEKVQNIAPTKKSFFNDWNIFNKTKNAKIVLILPFNVKNSPNNEIFDFYSGVLLAMKMSEKKECNIELNVYDCANNTIPVTEQRLNQTNMVIGPISAGQLSKICNMSSDNTSIISPLDPKAAELSNYHKNFIQVAPVQQAQYTNITKWIEDDYNNGDQVLTIYEKNPNSNHTNEFNKIIKSSGIHSNFFSYNILEGRKVQSNITNYLTKSGINRIIINSDNEAFVNDIIRNLNIIEHNKYNIIIYCLSKVKSFETIDVNNLHNLNAHIAMSYYIDYNSNEVKDFIMKYRALFNTEPTQFAFQGYDIAKYFIDMYNDYGNKWRNHLEDVKESILQTNFVLKQLENGGFINMGIRRIVYKKDYKIKVLD